MDFLPLEIENIIMDYKEQLELNDKVKRINDEIKYTIKYELYNDDYTSYLFNYKKREKIIYFHYKHCLYISKEDLRSNRDIDFDLCYIDDERFILI